MTQAEVLDIVADSFGAWQAIIAPRQARAVVDGLRSRGFWCIVSTQPDGTVRILSPGLPDAADVAKVGNRTAQTIAATMLTQERARFHEGWSRGRWA
jgi:hypothetical protein